MPLAAAPSDPEILTFDIPEGHTHNHFYRRGPIAAHLLLTSGPTPRIITAFPAGNTGIGLWFESTPTPIQLSLQAPLHPIERPDLLRGISATLTADSPALCLRTALLGSVRALRHHNHTREISPWMTNTTYLDHHLVIQRSTLHGHRIELAIEPAPGTHLARDPQGNIHLSAQHPHTTVQFTLTALTDETPLTPIPTHEILREGIEAHHHDLQALAFLTYQQKLLAGSFRFLTYFGRDTLLSLRMLMPALRPPVIEAALGSILDRLTPQGDVAHEEAIGEWAAMLHERSGHPTERYGEPILDYKMIDDDLLLAPIAAEYLLATPLARPRAIDFLARQTPSGQTYAQALTSNLDLVLRRAAPFAEDPTYKNLIALKDDKRVGEWRDSTEGLGLGRIPFNVNAALVPAALAAVSRLYASPLLGEQVTKAKHAANLLTAWRRAHTLFHVRLSASEARARLTDYTSSLGIDPQPALEALQTDLAYPALALNDDGTPVEVMHSDDGFTLLFADPTPEELEEAATRILRPFPAGLRTPVGVVVANPAFAPSQAVRDLFTPGHYHGAVVWSWQQAMLAAGLDRQLQRSDLPERTRGLLEEAKQALWRVIRATEEESTWELWTWAFQDGAYKLVPFGEQRSHHTESNAIQLWSTVYLAVRP